MSSRQKSFFDQNHKIHSNGYRQHYRSHGHDRAPQHDVKPPEPVRPPPIAASTQAKTKLHAFRLDDGTPTTPVRKSGKENLHHGSAHSPTRKGASLMTDTADNQSYLPPSTPAVRLPLADLLGNSEDAPRQALKKEDSPEEQLAWLAAGDPRRHNHTPVHRRKRAHSSSPTTSSQAETSARLISRKPFDIEALTTPRTDPAADLWTKYNGASMREEDTGYKLPSLVHLLGDVSPQELPRTPGGSLGGLRRWASCGTEWPESGPKRRKVQTLPTAGKPCKSRISVEKSNCSRLGAMVDLVEVNLVEARLSLPKAQRPDDDPSSSSPLPDKGVFEGLADGSPASKTTIQPGRRLSIAAGQSHTFPVETSSIKDPDQTSDYGDEDIDLTELAVDEFIDDDLLLDTNDLPSGHDSHSGYRNDMTNNDYAIPARNDAAMPVHPLTTIIEEDDDEFGDDDDLTAEDVEIAFTQIESVPCQLGYNARSTSHSNSIQTTSHQTNGDTSIINKPGGVDATFSDDDEFGGLDVDDEQFAAAELAATQAHRASAPSQGSISALKPRKIQRYLVQQVVGGNYLSERGIEQEEKVLVVEDEKSKGLRAITLRQSWLDTHCKAGAYVHVVGRFSETGHITIDDAANLLIVHPDHLVSATAVADSFDCLRKAVLQDRVKATNVTSKATVYGSILHELFQTAMQHNCWDVDWLCQVLSELVIKYIEGLFEAGAKDTNEAMETLTAKMPELRDWAGHFVRNVPSSTQRAQDRNGKMVNLSVTKLLDVEEHVWSPTYGLKGNIDATVEIAMEDDYGTKHLTVPFEVKTGKHQSAAHRAQTALYTLLLSDRYDVNVQYGVLYYMENSTVNRIPAIRNELRHMVMQRNELASYVRERLSLPPMLKNEFKCSRCYAKRSCFLYHKLSEDGTTETAGVGANFAQLVAKLKPAHQDFFKKWDELLTKEETELFKFRRELWTMLSHERQKLGRCFAEVVIEPGTAHEDKDAQKINRFTYNFVKKDASPGFSFAESQITVGEPIVISSEQGHFALANGYVTKVSLNRIGVAVDRRLHNSRIRQTGFDEISNQTFAAIMEVGKKSSRDSIQEHESDNQTVYRLDKDEFSNGMATVRNNLLAIMDDEIFQSYELRELIVQNKEPIFKPNPSAYTLSGPLSQMQINSDQRAAIDKIMSARDYALVLGMPGTGKTTTIAHIIRALVARGKSVLLTSYTHTAVDNILLKLRDSSTSILRLGVLAKIHPEVQEFARLAAIPRESIEELEEMYMTPQVVATTCLGINHQIFQKRIFDYCIVDEASQITLPVCLGPIRMARTFVLVGDHYQLPPLVQNKEAQEGGLDISLFKLLSDRQPASVVNLEHQYRMCAEIMHLSNTLIYGGRLKCGNEAVASRTLPTPKALATASFHSSPDDGLPVPPSLGPQLCLSALASTCQLSMLLDRSRKVIFANTDGIATGHEKLIGSRITNPYEVSVIHLVSSALLAQGITPAQMGIISFYRSQLSLLRQTLKHTSAETIEMHTVDKYQGRDKELILLSCVRSNKDSNVGDLLRDWRRVNVAITRAKSKFVIVGSKKTLMGDELWKKLIELVEDMGGMVNLNDSLLMGHCMDDNVGEVQAEKHRETPSPRERKPKVLNSGYGLANRGGLREPLKQGKIGKELLLKKRPISQDIMNMLM